MKKKKMSDYLTVGIAVSLCTAVGGVLGVLLQNVGLWLFIGAGVGVVLGGVLANIKPKDK